MRMHAVPRKPRLTMDADTIFPQYDSPGSVEKRSMSLQPVEPARTTIAKAIFRRITGQDRGLRALWQGNGGALRDPFRWRRAARRPRPGDPPARRIARLLRARGRIHRIVRLRRGPEIRPIAPPARNVRGPPRREPGAAKRGSFGASRRSRRTRRAWAPRLPRKRPAFV